jgi:acetylornithine deacetylase/succinyl-diaminopimelate desuccinylase-like protein
MKTIDLARAAREFDRNRERYVENWKAAVRFPSVGADPGHASDCRDCAAWFAGRLREAGFSAELLETGEPPVVFAERKGVPGKPVILIYGHYDVQPVDPIEAWNSPPFEPEFREGRLYGRGAQDNKGQLCYVLAALETLNRLAGAELCTIKVLLEGQEESGSGGLSRALPGWAERLKADVLLVADTYMADSGAPSIVMGLRGIVHFTLTVDGPLRDLHSGTHGGVAPNPAAALCGLIAGLHGPDGRVAVEGFEDGCLPPTARERELLGREVFDPARYEEQTGVAPVGGERARAPLERLGFRPTLEVNGIHGGYGGAGSKTIIPAQAFAKLSVRLAGGQDPARVIAVLESHFKKHQPAGLRVTMSDATIGGPALRLDADSPVAARAAAVLREVCGREPAFHWEGASIPVLTLLAEVAGGARPLLTGFGMEEDHVHAPNESFPLERFRLGYLYMVRLLNGW